MTDLKRRIARDIALTLSGQARSELLEPEIQASIAEEELGPLVWYLFQSNEVLVHKKKAIQTLAQNELFLHERDRINATLSHGGIRPIWLKGSVLMGLYPHPTCRPMLDLDFWIQGDERTVTRKLLETLSYLPEQAHDRDYEVAHKIQSATTHHDVYFGGPGGHVQLEVHFELLSKIVAHEASYERLRAEVNEQHPLLQLNTHANLVYLSAHALLGHSEQELTLLRLLDVHLLIQKQPPNWDACLALAEQMGWDKAFKRMMHLCATYFDSSIPAPYHNQFEPLSRFHPRTAKSLARLKYLSLGQRAAYILTQLVPKPSYMRQRYGQGGLLRLYLRRWWHLIRTVTGNHKGLD